MHDRERLIGDIADAVPCQTWRLRRLAERGKVPSRRLGRLLVFSLDDLPQIREVARAAGYLMVARAAEAVGV